MIMEYVLSFFLCFAGMLFLVYKNIPVKKNGKHTLISMLTDGK